jgi:hypothetical protein
MPGSALSRGVQLVYASAGVEQAPWVYDSLTVSTVVSRPIGEHMRLEKPLANGGRVVYETGARASHKIGETMYIGIPTTVTTYDSAGKVLRRLREDYAPALLTALRGVFEEPDANGWRVTREFGLKRLTQP